ncbi:transposase [Streptomyces sp. ME08-AFT2]|uniref:transposase n=1 Tax=Streptomyces sp. ME08-AFT2 TaxID=3028683 RepID=UPI0029BE64A7|nr:transposase [Streptomyces sp. ME08-AFT2]MDX3314857.1 transposase [Streptomyces sp. ME08-AFT2]
MTASSGSFRPSIRLSRSRGELQIEWKYALGLELEDTGFDYSLLCDFRARLVEGDVADRMLRVMLTRLTEAGLLKAGGRQHTDATYVLAAVRQLSRLELAGESLRAALEELAERAPGWLLPLIKPEWDKRYGRRIEIRKVPGGPEAVVDYRDCWCRAIENPQRVGAVRRSSANQAPSQYA